MPNLFKKLLLIFSGLIIVVSFGSFNLTSNNTQPILSSGKARIISPALLPTCPDKEESSENKEETKEKIEVIKEIKISKGIVKKPEPITIKVPENPVLAVIDWEEKEKEVEKARETSSVPLGIQCGGGTFSKFGIGPVFFRPCCSGCCIPCPPLTFCPDCGCLVASCQRVCEVCGNSAYLWDSVTGLCGCGI